MKKRPSELNVVDRIFYDIQVHGIDSVLKNKDFYNAYEPIGEEKGLNEIFIPKNERIAIGNTFYHKEIYDGKEPMKIVGIRENEIELEGDFSGGTHHTIGRGWFSIIGLFYNKNIIKNK